MRSKKGAKEKRKAPVEHQITPVRKTGKSAQPSPDGEGQTITDSTGMQVSRRGTVTSYVTKSIRVEGHPAYDHRSSHRFQEIIEIDKRNYDYIRNYCI